MTNVTVRCVWRTATRISTAAHRGAPYVDIHVEDSRSRVIATLSRDTARELGAALLEFAMHGEVSK